MMLALTTPKHPTNVSFFYLRRKKWGDDGKHRFACVALTKETNGYRVAYSFTAPVDRFNANLAKKIATERLNSTKTKVVSFADAKDLATFAYTLGIHPHLSQYGPFTYALNESTFHGAKLELEPKNSHPVEVK